MRILVARILLMAMMLMVMVTMMTVVMMMKMVMTMTFCWSAGDDNDDDGHADHDDDASTTTTMIAMLLTAFFWRSISLLSLTSIRRMRHWAKASKAVADTAAAICASLKATLQAVGATGQRNCG